MLQAPPHLSRVCGHGHIKKFWLMQTQKESQASERKSNFLFPSPTSCAGSTVSAKGPDSSPRNLQSPVLHGYGDTGTSAKHSSFTCAETLSPSFCKKSHPHLPVSTGPAMKRMGRSSGLNEVCRTLDQEVQPCTPSPRSYPLNVAFGSERKYGDELERMVTKADPEESLHSQGPNKSEDSLSTSAGDSPHSFNSHGQFHPSRPGKDLLKPSDRSRGNHCTKGEYCSSPAQTSMNVGQLMNGDAVPRRMQFPTSSTIEDYSVSRRNSHDTSHIHNEQQYQAANSGLKACTRCGTTKTPMWRCGPQGPKSLCNACGIRFKKYRSIPGQNEFPSHPVSPSAGHSTPKSLARPLKRKQDSVLLTGEIPRPQKMCLKSVVAGVTLRQENKNEVIVTRGDQNQLKRAERVGANRWTTPAAPACFKKIYGCFPFQSKFKKLSPIDEHLTLSRVFKDEEEAALLLMHLSCGLVY